MDEKIFATLAGLIGTAANHHSNLTSIIGENAVQGLTVVNTAAIQQAAMVSDDSGLIAALQTAAGAPKQGAIVGA